MIYWILVVAGVGK